MIKYDINNDLDFIYENLKEEFEIMSNSSILITGASGFFGTWLVSLINRVNYFKKTNIFLTLITRDIKNITYLNNSSNGLLNIIEANLLNINTLPANFDYVIHMAATTAHETFNGEPDSSKVNTLNIGTSNLLSSLKSSKLKSILFTSSGVVYGVNDKPVSEELEFDLTKLKYNGLAIGKIEAERLVSEYAIKNNINYKIARCFSFAGPYLPLNIHYAIGNFILDALNKDFIKVNSDGSAKRSFLYIGDAIIWLIKLLISKNKGVFNVGSENSISIRELAKKVASLISPNKDIVFHFSNDGCVGNFNRDIYLPNVSKIKNDLGVREYHSLDEIILKTANIC